LKDVGFPKEYTYLLSMDRLDESTLWPKKVRC
jgi:hypothetical protein